MSFLTKKETALIGLVQADQKLTDSEKKEKITEINYLARLRSDRYRKPVKIFLHALVSFKNDSTANGLMT